LTAPMTLFHCGRDKFRILSYAGPTIHLEKADMAQSFLATQ
jgi:hypothetical protein